MALTLTDNLLKGQARNTSKTDMAPLPAKILLPVDVHVREKERTMKI